MIYTLIALYNFIYVYSDKEKEIFEQTDLVETNKSGIQKPQAITYIKVMTMNIKQNAIAKHMWLDY